MDLSDDPGAVRAYLYEVSRTPLLEADEERRLVVDVGSDDRSISDSARDQLMRMNQRLVVSIARKHVSEQHPLASLVRSGNEGLERAVHSFAPDRGFRFSTYAKWLIRQAITRATG